MKPEQADTAPDERRGRWIETLTVGVLAITALAAAWSGYQSAVWRGTQSTSYVQAGGARTNGAQERTEANQFRLADLSVFEAYIEATAEGNTELADFYSNRFRDEFRVAFDAWIAQDPFENPNAPPTPLAMDEYQLATDLEADRLMARADEFLAAGEAANKTANTYTLGTLLFASVLFFAAISQRFDRNWARSLLLGLALVGLVAGITVAAGQPVTFG